MGSVLRIGLIGSYVPKKCGIATFSRDLLGGIKDNEKNVRIFIAAAEHSKEAYKYNKEVVAILKTNDPETYLEASKKLNVLDLDVVLLQHEFGLFGGKFTTFIQDSIRKNYPTGNQIFKLIDKLDSQLITTLHTVIAKPDPVRKAVISKIANRSVSIVTMTQSSKVVLCKDYGISESKIFVIPHGTPRLVKKDRKTMLEELRLGDKNFYLVMSGLLGPNKGIDLAINAMPNILKKHPEVRLIVLGQTHPDILAVHGNAYIDSLIDLAKRLGITHAILFIDKYVPTDELSKYLSITDIYLTPHRDPQQAASGTLAYAVGNGLITISTPYSYAKEMLADDRGFLVPFENSQAITRTVNRLINDKDLMRKTKRILKPYGDKMSWEAVGKAYLEIIKTVLN